MNESQDCFQGKIEYHSTSFVKGWAINRTAPNEPVYIDVLVGEHKIATLCASLFRWDLKAQGIGQGYHGFVYPIQSQYLDGQRHVLNFRFERTGEALENSPATICASYERQRIPFETTALTGRRVLVLAPHPDDESLGCGSAIRLHRNNQDPVKVVFVTDGSRGDFKQDYARDDYVRLRETEAQEAGRVLGVEVADIDFWRIEDRTLVATETLINRLVVLLQHYQPELVYAPSPLEFHPDHQATAMLLWRAVQHAHIELQVAFYEVNRPLNVNTLVDISGVIDQKRQACDAYISQLQYCPYTDFAVSLNRFRALTVSGSCSYVEGYCVLSSREIARHPIERFALKQTLPMQTLHTHSLPLVSVIVRTKDRPQLLQEALSSLLTQTYPSLEVVVVNDGGQDVSTAIEHFNQYLKITYRTHATSRGAAAAANTGLAVANGKYINFLDDDDLLYPEHLEKLALFLETTGEKVAYSDCEKGEYRWDGTDFVLAKEKKLFRGIEFDRDRLHCDNYLASMSVLFTRELWDQIGPLDECSTVSEDKELWRRLADQAMFHRLPGITAEYRQFVQRDHQDAPVLAPSNDRENRYRTRNNPVRQIWSRIDALEAENQRLREALAQVPEEFRVVEHFSQGGKPLRWLNVIKRLVKFLPHSLLIYLYPYLIRIKRLFYSIHL
ncbi:MAG: glycosyltransferase [Candidatus Competibacteraceae bacterium]|nr:glycosyltransferase [Candidatus Competibacteraceae bacterium]